MKYIDAEKFIKEFEKIIDDIPASVDSGAGYVIDKVYKIITSFQQEQPAKRGYKDCNGHKPLCEDYVSFETAKLLREKGFDEYCKSVYHVGSVCSVASLRYRDNEGYGALIEEKQNSDFGKYDNAISAPTLQMAMKWLREVKKLNCIVDVSFNQKRNGESEYYFCVWENKPPYELLRESPIFSTYEEACEAAIKYCLENLI